MSVSIVRKTRRTTHTPLLVDSRQLFLPVVVVVASNIRHEPVFRESKVLRVVLDEDKPPLPSPYYGPAARDIRSPDLDEHVSSQDVVVCDGLDSECKNMFPRQSETAFKLYVDLIHMSIRAFVSNGRLGMGVSSSFAFSAMSTRTSERRWC
jgi:hypothetical protein